MFGLTRHEFCVVSELWILLQLKCRENTISLDLPLKLLPEKMIYDRWIKPKTQVQRCKWKDICMLKTCIYDFESLNLKPSSAACLLCEPGLPTLSPILLVIIRAAVLPQRIAAEPDWCCILLQMRSKIRHQNGRWWPHHHAQDTPWIVNSSHMLMKTTYNTIFFINCYSFTETNQDFAFFLLEDCSKFSQHSQFTKPPVSSLFCI